MLTKILLFLVWSVFIAYIGFLAPLDQPGTLTLMEKMLTFRWSGINPIVIAIFWLMGVWPMIYAGFLFIDARQQVIPAWPSFLTSNGAGVVGLLPYLILRRPNQDIPKTKDIWLKIVDSRLYGIGVSVAAFALLAYAVFAGDWTDYLKQLLTHPFVHLISIDFTLMWLILPTILPDDLARRGLKDSRIFWFVTLVPLIGALAYICFRPPLPEK